MTPVSFLSGLLTGLMLVSATHQMTLWANTQQPVLPPSPIPPDLVACPRPQAL